MSKLSIGAVGVELATDDVVRLEFTEKQSLLDFDIVLLRPSIDQFLQWDDSFNGKTCLSDDRSFQLKECCEHWRREIRNLVEVGKTAIVFLSELQECYVATGSHSYSGTGRNQKTTRHVGPFNNYQLLPIKIDVVPSAGKSVKLASKGAEAITSYWSEFKDSSSYKVIIKTEAPLISAALMTRVGDKPVGLIRRSKSSAGAIVLLPDVDFNQVEFTATKSGEEVWTAVAEQFAQRFLASVVEMDRALRAEGEVTPMPLWAKEIEYTIGTENKLRSELLQTEREVELAVKRKEEKEDELLKIGRFRGLLFEKGRPLESSIIDALHILGFSAAPFSNAESEFDVVFSCSDGRLIGEAEGKDTKAISIEKMRQLSMNVHEDLMQATVETPAKPVLFGNPFRLTPVSDRASPFTDKCVSAAVTSSTALLFTPDLFLPVQYLLSNPDEEYAKDCRMAIISAIGRVTFAPPPAKVVSIQTPSLELDEGI
jgi:ethanolamine utilization microcompartment shell protein EutS